MKKLILIIGCLTLVFNILSGLLLSRYSYFNMGVNCGIIALDTALVFGLYLFNLRDVFRISFTFLFAFLGIVDIVIGCFMPQKLEDNGCLIAIIIILLVKISLFVIANIFSNKIKK